MAVSHYLVGWDAVFPVPSVETGAMWQLIVYAAFGLVVRDATGPAATGGVRQGDVIVSVDGAAIASMDAFASSVGKRKPGDVVALGVLRDGKAQTVSVTLGAKPN